ncbi:MAG: HlyD family efflux transporter periplasmic adaptor subunit, partial [Bacteroidia bacterium]
DLELFKNNVISKQEFYQKQTEYNNKQLQLEQLEQAKVQNEVAINSLKLQLDQGVFNKDSKNKGSLEAIQSHKKNISNYIFGWQQKFRLVAANDGKIIFLNNLHPNQFLKAGEEIFALFQPNDSIIALAEVPVAGFGKVKAGQKVNLLMDNFPHYDYGTLHGVVSKIALLPNTNYYRVQIALPSGMTTAQGKAMKFTPEMTGMAEIVTDDKTVMQRIFKSILKLFESK